MTVFADANELLARLQLLAEVATMRPRDEADRYHVEARARDYLNDRLRNNVNKGESTEYRRVSLNQVQALRQDGEAIAQVAKMHEQALVALVFSMQRSLWDLCLKAEPEAAHMVELGMPADDPDTGVMAPFHKRTFEGDELEAPALPKFLVNLDDHGWE